MDHFTDLLRFLSRFLLLIFARFLLQGLLLSKLAIRASRSLNVHH